MNARDQAQDAYNKLNARIAHLRFLLAEDDKKPKEEKQIRGLYNECMALINAIKAFAKLNARLPNDNKINVPDSEKELIEYLEDNKFLNVDEILQIKLIISRKLQHIEPKQLPEPLIIKPLPAKMKFQKKIRDILDVLPEGRNHIGDDEENTKIHYEFEDVNTLLNDMQELANLAKQLKPSDKTNLNPQEEALLALLDKKLDKTNIPAIAEVIAQEFQTDLAFSDTIESAPVTNNANVLTLVMLGSNEHSSKDATVLTELYDNLQEDSQHSKYMFGGPGGESTDKSNPRLGTYEHGDVRYDPVTGKLHVPKEASSSPITQASGLLAGKGMDHLIAESLAIVDSMMTAGKKPLVLNMYGFSRGADNALRLANELNARYRRDEVIVNILAIDPVPGFNRQHHTRARLIPGIVKNYESILMRDDQRTTFKVQDKAHHTVEDIEYTKQRYRMYHGTHTAGIHFRVTDATAKEVPKHTQHAARLVWNDVESFAREHGSTLTSENCLQYVNKRLKTKFAPDKKINDEYLLSEYSKMLHEFSGKKRTRSFNRYQSDYFLHGNGYFLDEKHMQIFKRMFPALFNFYFEMNSHNHAREDVVSDIRKLINVENRQITARDKKLQPSGMFVQPLAKFLRVDLYSIVDPRSTTAITPQGIHLDSDHFYADDSRLQLLWNAVQNAVHPVMVGFDKSVKKRAAQALYHDVRTILAKDTPNKEQKIISRIQDALLVLPGNQTSAYANRLASLLQKFSPYTPALPAHQANSYIRSELEKYIKQIDQTNGYDLNLAKLLFAKTSDPCSTTLLNKMVLTTLAASTALMEEGKKPAGDFHRFLRTLSLNLPITAELTDSDKAKINDFLESMPYILDDELEMPETGHLMDSEFVTLDSEHNQSRFEQERGATIAFNNPLAPESEPPISPNTNFRRILNGSQVSSGRMMGEFTASQLLTSLLNHLYQNPEYGRQHVSALSLVNAQGQSGLDTSVHLKELAVENSEGTLADVAFREAGKKPRKTMLNKTKRKVPSNWLLNHPALLKQFCVSSMTRMLVGDMNVGPTSYQVVGSGDQQRLVATDFSASMINLAGDLNVFAKATLDEKTGKTLVKNGLYEYSKEVRLSVEMAEAMIEVGRIDPGQISQVVQALLQKENVPYSPDAIKSFCKYLGMNDATIGSDPLAQVTNFLTQQLRQRACLLQYQGYELLLKHCLDGNNLNEARLQMMLNKYPTLRDYVLDVMRIDGYQCLLLSPDTASNAIATVERIESAAANRLSTMEAIVQTIASVARDLATDLATMKGAGPYNQHMIDYLESRKEAYISHINLLNEQKISLMKQASNSEELQQLGQADIQFSKNYLKISRLHDEINAVINEQLTPPTALAVNKLDFEPLFLAIQTAVERMSASTQRKSYGKLFDRPDLAPARPDPDPAARPDPRLKSD